MPLDDFFASPFTGLPRLERLCDTFQKNSDATSCASQARRPMWRCGYVRCARDKAASRSTTATGR